jgi:conjugative transfer signal peptidase TraF
MTGKKREKTKRIKFLKVVATVIIGFSVVMLIFKGFGLRVNFTNSMPRGLYSTERQSSYHTGDFVIVCLPDSIAQEGYDRGYLEKGISCPNRIEPLIKEIIAVPGDTVELTDTAMIVNNKPYAAPLFQFDRKGRPTHYIPRTIYPNTNTYWLYGEHDPNYSWDSRYYGGVEASNIIGRAHPLFTF